MPARLIVCTTCDRRADPPAVPSRGAQLVASVREAASAAGVALEIVAVDCLDGCTRPANAALRSRGKPFLRFSGLTPADAPALVAASLAYAADPQGRVGPGLRPTVTSLPLQHRRADRGA